MSTNKLIAISIIVLEVAIATVGFYAIFAFSQIQEREVKNKAIDECTKAAINVKEGEMIEFVYKLCLKDKGYK